MADKLYPLPVFHFRVQFGTEQLGFTEVSGLTQERQAIEYRAGDFPEYSTIKYPGMAKYTNLVFKRGVMASDNKFFEWLNSGMKLSKVDRKDLTISLLNENHEPVMTWKAIRAFPVKIEGPQLKATGNEVAIESIEIAHEGLTIENL
ncbi:phage tail protein [Chamaesiphon sp. VAR_48_metabat_135_sub]|uniref:phage tail protein n=1 Tax=Chamaesiphon sp. VAR_48_metabat_135_sub TaxID=2964699 RepID=UPI00286D39B5|nr:phage tail protein [Chamaesiphon sp. VAR_48_metabat_135_sub]